MIPPEMKQLSSLLPAQVTLLQDQPIHQPASKGLWVVSKGITGLLAVPTEHPTADKAGSRGDVLARG